MNATTTQVTPSDPAPGPGATNRIVPLVFGTIALLVALALLAGGGAAVWGLSQRDASGYFTTADASSVDPNVCIRLGQARHRPRHTGRDRRLRENPDTSRLSETSVHRHRTRKRRRPIPGTRRAFSGYRHRHRSVQAHRSAHRGHREAVAAGRRAHLASASVRKRNTNDQPWPLEKGRWSAVVMNADGSRTVSVE